MSTSILCACVLNEKQEPQFPIFTHKVAKVVVSHISPSKMERGPRLPAEWRLWVGARHGASTRSRASKKRFFEGGA